MCNLLKLLYGLFIGGIRKKAYYHRVGACVEIDDPCIGVVTLSRESVLIAINNVKSNRSKYATEEAYQDRLSVYTGALAFLDKT